MVERKRDGNVRTDEKNIKRKTKEKTGGFIGKVLKKHHFKLRKSNKMIFAFKN